MLKTACEIKPSTSISHQMEEFGIFVLFFQSHSDRFLSPKSFFQHSQPTMLLKDWEGAAKPPSHFSHLNF